MCEQFPYVNFIIGGDGPKYPLLSGMIVAHQLQHRVELLGQVPHTDVARVLNRGQIFLNMSLTEGAQRMPCHVDGSPCAPTALGHFVAKT